MSAHAEPRDAAAGALGPKLLAWWAHMSNNDAEAMRVAAEIRGGLEAWEKNERWAPLRHAGTRDTAERTLFDMILAGDIPSDKVIMGLSMDYSANRWKSWTDRFLWYNAASCF